MAPAALTKCRVTGPVLKPDGTPFYPATISFALSRRDRDDGIVLMPAPVLVNTDVDGNIDVSLWPNAEGIAGTVYVARIALTNETGGTSLYPVFHLVVPVAAEANFAALIETVPPASVDDARAQVIIAQQILADINTAVTPVIDNLETLQAIETNLPVINTVSNSIGAVQAVAAIDEDIETVASIAGPVVIVATDREAVETVAANIDIVNEVIDNLPLIEAVPALAAQTATDVLTSATNATVATDAKNAALTSELNSAASASNAAQTKALMDAALAAVSGGTLIAQLTGGAKLVVSAADVVAAFVYDTGNDSDRGAWRLKTKHTSWFNEALNTATRGSRNFFPKKALIVARPSSVTIYDMDNKDCPMWMVWNQASFKWSTGLTASSVVALNGQIHLGTSGRALVLDLIADIGGMRVSSGYSQWLGRVADRHIAETAYAVTVNGQGIVNATVNAVAATILPGTPPDPRRAGLPAPTVGVGTAGGVSVIHWDGRVCNSASTLSWPKLAFERDGTLIGTSPSNGSIFRAAPSVYSVMSFNLAWAFKTPGQTYQVPAFLGANGTPSFPLSADAFGNTFGLTVFGPKNPIPQNNAVAYMTSTYLTGWQVGDMRMALGESTADVTSPVGATVISTAFASYADQAAMEADGWTFQNCTAEILAGKLRLTATAIAGASPQGSGPMAVKSVNVVAGKRYDVRSASSAGNGSRNGRIYLRDAADTVNRFAGPLVANGVMAGIFDCQITETVKLKIGIDSSAAIGNVNAFDDVTIRVALADRSAAGNNPVVVGTLTRQAVAAGAELAAYSGFSASNYLELSYTSALDFGTGDWCAGPVWFKGVADGALISRRDPAGTGAVISIDVAAGVVRANGGITIAGTTNVNDGRWHFASAVRRAGVLEIWLDGRLENSAASTTNATNTSAILRIGTRANDTAYFYPGSIALPRVSATAPTPAQIRAMYADEAPLFQPGAKCLLTGSDNVQGVDVDAATGLLYAAKAAGGTDVFKGLARVGTMTMASENTLGAELVVNGDFATDTTWTKGTGWTISGGLATKAAGTAAYLSQPSTIANGDAFLFTYTVSGRTAGSVQTRLENGLGSTRSADGTYVDYVVATSANPRIILSADASFNGSIDNVSVKKVVTGAMTSDNHKSVSASNDNISIATAAEVFAKLPTIGLRELLGHNGGPPLYDRDVAEFDVVTTNATPTVGARFPLDKGERGIFTVYVTAWTYGDGAQYAAYVHEFEAYRPEEGNIALLGAVTTRPLTETTASMDSAIAANTTAQTIDNTVTGVASINLVWKSEWVRRA